MFRVLLLLLVLVTMLFAQGVMAQDDGMMGDKMMDESMKGDKMSGEFNAVVIEGRARIRAGASLDDEVVGHCAKGDRLTVWVSGMGDWLLSSCYGVNGFIHGSLVEIGEAVVPSDDAMMMDEDKMMDESMKYEMMDDSMDDKMMDDSMKDEMMTGEFSAVVINGPARIRTGASLENAIVGLCPKGYQLTVWLPGEGDEGDWLIASCHNLNGYVHNSLVEVGKQVIPTITELGDSDDMDMKDDMSGDGM